MRKAFLAAALLLAATRYVAAQNDRHVTRDTLPHAGARNGIVTTADPTDYDAVRRNLDAASRESFFRRTFDRLRRPLAATSSNRNFNAAATAGIGYAQETGFSVAAAVTGEYSTRRRDSLTQPSDIALAGSVSVTGFYRIRISGNTLFGRGADRLTFGFDMASLPVRFWGLGYEAADKNPRTRYTRKRYSASVRYMRRIIGAFSAGASLDFRHAAAHDPAPECLRHILDAGQPRHAMSAGIGIAAEFDTRDDATSARHGVFLSLLAEMRPRGLGDCGTDLWHITAVADMFRPLWRDAVMAVDLYADLWSSAAPWLFWPEVGGAYRMRGYYAGRYTDRKMVAAQIELRQRVWGPVGCCVWAGAANVCASHKLFDWSETLPDFGLGLRLALGGKTGLRIDYGFGRRSNGLVININEAF